MDEIEGRFAAQRRSMAAIEEDVTRLQRKKAEHEDLDALNKRVSTVETEWRDKSSNLTSEIAELRRLINGLIRSTDHLAESLEKVQAATPPISAPSGTLANPLSVWERIPKWAYLLMGMGVLALVQQGPGLLFKVQGLGIGQ